MRIVSLVPSWTETLLACGADVVGRTKFCDHPAGRVENIPAVGGTKQLDAEQIASLKPDLLILDKEENLPEMAVQGSWKIHATHIQSIDDMSPALSELGKMLKNQQLESMAREWEEVCNRPLYPSESLQDIPGIENWIRKPEIEPEQFLYLIWRSPWMAVSRATFVGSMFNHLGYGGRMIDFDEKYPRLDLGDFSPEKTLLLFSSEPFPFREKAQELKSLDFSSAIINGEVYSWFGIRALKFLQQQMGH